MSRKSKQREAPTTWTAPNERFAWLQHMTVYKDWIGRTSITSDVVTAFPLRALSATADRDDPPAEAGTPLPYLWHWLFFLPTHRSGELRHDGHAHGSGFMPPIDLPRRMWAGSKFIWNNDNPLRVGESVKRISRVESITPKSGRSGELVFVKMRHEFHNDAGLSFVNEHTTAFRSAAKEWDGKSAPTASQHRAIWQRELIPDEVLLFRYSALTHNTHRIHYDWRHATEQENYPALVVQGPLIATLLMDLLRRNAADAPVLSLELKAVRPTFAGRPMRLCGHLQERTVLLWSEDHDGWVTMNATAEIAQTH